MRWIWMLVAVLLAAAAAALWPRSHVEDSAIVPSAAPAVARTVAPPAAVPSTSAPAATIPPKPSFGVDFSSTPTPELTPGPAADIERLDDRTIRLDGRYTVHGSGSEQDPYLVTWELLSSARDSINAQERRYVLPGRLAPLQDAWVQISGYWAPPLQRFESRDVLMMLNKWDGCCIGLPPTPFDSMEVTLAAPVAILGQHLFRYGTVRGRLHIAPFAASGFLLGLYRLEDAVLESS